MPVIVKPGALVLAAATEDGNAQFTAWRGATQGRMSYFEGGPAKRGALQDLGPREDACREPITIAHGNADRRLQIGNLAETPFTMRGETYASIERVWQGLKFAAEDGAAARRSLAS